MTTLGAQWTVSTPASPPPLPTTVPIVLFGDEWGGVGGTAGYVVMLGRELSRRGYDVAALCHGGQGTEAMRSSLAAVGVRVHLIPVSHSRPPLRQLRELAGLTRLLRPYRGGILALMMGYFTRGGSATVAGRLAGMSVVRADLTPPEPPIGRISALSLRLKDRLTDRVVVGAIENIQAFQRDTGRNPSRLSVIHTGIELERFQPGVWRAEARRELGFDDDQLVIGTVSRLDDERKGLRYFLSGAASFGSAFPNARFLVAGDGVRRAEYEALAASMGIRDRCLFAGWRSDVPRLLDAMDVFVMSSTHEGGPTSVLEAMAMAKPVVASRVGMVPEVIDHGVSGLIVPPADAGAIAASLRMLVGDASLRSLMGMRARERALSSLGIDRMANDYLRTFAEVLRARGRLPGSR